MNNQIPSKEEILLAHYEAKKHLPSLMIAADTNKNQGNLIQALQAYEQLIVTLRNILQLEELNNRYYPDTPFEIPSTVHHLLDAMTIEADVLDALRHPVEAESRREEAEQLARRYLTEAGIADVERQRAGSLIGQGRFNEALVALTSARDVFQSRQDVLNTASVAADIAGILEWLGDYERALAEVKQALEFIASLSAPVGHSLAGVEGPTLQDFQELQRAMKIEAIQHSLGLTEAVMNRHLGHFDEADSQFRTILSKTPPEIRPAIETQFAINAISRGQYQEGLVVLEKLEPTYKGLLRPRLGVFMSYKGEAFLMLGKPGEALAILDVAIQELTQYHDIDFLWKTQWRRGRALAALSRPLEALAAYAQSIDIINNLRKAPLGYRLDSTYLKDKLPVFDAAIHLACDNQEGEACCRFIEAIKARTLSAILGIPAGGEAKITGKLDQQLDGLTQQLDAVEYIANSTGWSDELEKKKTSLQAQRAELLEQIRYSDPRWRSLSEPVPFDLQKVVNLLSERQQAALTLYYQPTQVIGVLIQNGQLLVAKTQLSDRARQALAGYQENLQSTRPKPEWFDLSSGLHLDSEHLIPAKLLKHALQSKSLIIVPHGPLHLVPWAGLIFQGKRLFEFCPVGILPNLSCIPSLAAELSTAPRVALIGAPDYRALRMPPLLQAEIELRDIEGIYLGHGGVVGQVFVGKDATEANFWRLAKDPDGPRNILHISSHGAFEADEPMNSGLLFSDTRVDASEIARAGLQYDELILIACSTGFRPTEVQGIVLSVDDILGLPGALLEAGVRSVLVSIPPAREDASQRFMTLYHESRAEGISPLHAFQETQLAMLQDSDYPPYLWAGFTLYGYQ